LSALALNNYTSPERLLAHIPKFLDPLNWFWDMRLRVSPLATARFGAVVVKSKTILYAYLFAHKNFGCLWEKHKYSYSIENM
jgi:hypothetical protein